MNGVSTSRLKGVSLIELMIAMAIGVVLLLGLVQVFAASRTAYQLSEGLARVQENGRFAVDFLQRDIRMAGHMGCVNDQARFLSPTPGLKSLFVAPVTNLAAGDERARFDVAVQAYEANGTAPGNTVNLAAPAAGWTPALPAHIAGLAPLPGSDIIMLRYFSAEGVPVTVFAPGATATISFDSSRANVLRTGGVANPGVFAISDCLNATVFEASAGTNLAAGTVVVGNGGLNVSDFSAEAYLAGQAVLYRADSVAYYIANNPAGNPALYRTRFTATPGGGAWATQTDELVEGIENMQLLYGQDREVNPAVRPTGYIENFGTADNLILVGTAEETWRRVGMVKVGLLVTSPDRAAVPQATVPLSTEGVAFTAPNDGRMRTVYETSIALRNRLYGN